MIPYDISLKYMITGYVVIFTVLVVYLGSLVARFRRLRRDLKLIADQEQQ